MTDFDLEHAFDYVILGLHTIFSLVEEKDGTGCFKLVRKHLEKEGRFLIDLMFPSSEDLRNTEGKYRFSILEGPGSKIEKSSS